MIFGCAELLRTLADATQMLALGRQAEDEDQRLLTPELEVEAKRMAHLLVRAVELASDSGAMQELYAILDAPAADDGGQPLFVAWVELIEQFVQVAEITYGSGKGPLKLRFVEAAVLRFLRRVDDTLPWSTAFDPFVFKVVVDFIVEAVVRLSNRAELWLGAGRGVSAPPAAGSLAALWIRFVSWLRDLAWRIVLLQYRVPAKLETAIDAVATDKFRALLGDTIRRVMGLIVWAEKHKNEVLAIVDVLYSAVKEAEKLAELPGPAKKEYARTLIVAFLEETGFLRGRSELLLNLVNGFLDGAIESVVQLLKKRKPGWELHMDKPGQPGGPTVSAGT